MPDLADLTADDFEPHVGSPFTVDLGGDIGADLGIDPSPEPQDPQRREDRADHPGPLDLTLVEVARRPPRPDRRTPFSLLFRGPDAPVLATTVHRLTHAELGSLDLFLGPVLAGGAGVTYEAVFA